MDHLVELKNKSVYTIREEHRRFKNITLLWSIVKDSATLLWITRKAFLGRIPFLIVYFDTSFKFPELYKFSSKYTEQWHLDFIVGRTEQFLAGGMCPERNRLGCYAFLKKGALKQVIDKYKNKGEGGYHTSKPARITT